jgi:hypothetical protein
MKTLALPVDQGRFGLRVEPAAGKRGKDYRDTGMRIFQDA